MQKVKDCRPVSIVKRDHYKTMQTVSHLIYLLKRFKKVSCGGDICFLFKFFLFLLLAIYLLPLFAVDICCSLQGSPQEGVGGYSHFFFIRRLGPSIYHSPPKNSRNFKLSKKLFEILATQKNIPHSLP